MERRISSAQYVAAVLRFLEAYNRADLDACVAACDPDVAWYTSPQLLEESVYRGREDVRAFLEALRTRWEDPKVEPEDFLEINGHVMMISRFYGTGSFTRRPYDMRESWVVTLNEDGKMARVVPYPTPADARLAIEALREPARG